MKLRPKLLAITALALVPALIVGVGYMTSQSRLAEERTRSDAALLLSNDTHEIKSDLQSAKDVLVLNAATYAVVFKQWNIAQGNMERLAASQPGYVDFGVCTADGRVVAASSKRDRGKSLSAQTWFKRAMELKTFAVGDYQVGTEGRPATLYVALPTLDSAGTVEAVSYVAFDVARLRSSLLRVSPSSGSAVTLIDSGGTPLVREPELANLIGKSAAGTPLVRQVLAQGHGTTQTAGFDGVARDYAFTEVFPGVPGSPYLLLGLSPAQAFAAQRRDLYLSLAGAGAIGLIALAAAWIAATYWVYRPVRQLQLASGRLASGDLAARADLPGTGDEFGALGSEFDRMATSVETQVYELKKARMELKALNATLEERVRRRTAELETSNKELEAFSYSVSHDLRAPLRAIDGFSQVLLEDYNEKLEEGGRDALDRVREAARRMGELIDSLLSLSRLSRQGLEVQHVDLSAMVEEVATDLRASDAGRDVVFDVEAGVTAEADPGLVRVALNNLISNAWKFTGERPVAHITFGTEMVDGETAYFVKDDGAGFDMAHAGKLFGAFQRLHRQSEFPGIGIGLATVGRIVHRHGGRIWAQGVPGEGAAFFFTLPGSQGTVG